jgi:hypothetical protein
MGAKSWDQPSNLEPRRKRDPPSLKLRRDRFVKRGPGFEFSLELRRPGLYRLEASTNLTDWVRPGSSDWLITVKLWVAPSCEGYCAG